MLLLPRQSLAARGRVEDDEARQPSGERCQVRRRLADRPQGPGEEVPGRGGLGQRTRHLLLHRRCNA